MISSDDNQPIFTMSDDGWCHVEAIGEHENAAAGVIQVIDAIACKAIVEAFEKEAAQPNFAGIVIDADHLKHSPEHTTQALGWLMELEARDDGLWGFIRWTNIGLVAIQGGAFRFFSTEYSSADMIVINPGKSPKEMRPMRLDGLSVTNMPNNKSGQRPITNRHSIPGNGPEADLEAVIAKNRQDAIDTYRANKKCGFEFAFNAVRRARPELFGLPARPAAPAVANKFAPRPAEKIAPVPDRATQIANSRALDKEIRDLRNRQSLSYAQASSKVRESHPHLFGLPAHPVEPPVVNKQNPLTEKAKQRENSAKINSAIAEIRNRTNCSFSQAHDDVRRAHPEFFQS